MQAYPRSPMVWCTFGWLPLAVLPPLSAQTAAPAVASAAATRAASAEDPIRLSPFEVIAEEDGSYLATHTLAGTRFNTELKDVPASLSVMTADFLRDIGANNLNDAMAYAINAENDTPGQNGNNLQGSDLQLNMRGFASSVVGRNYFESQTSQDSYNMERATFSRGPNSVLFGSGGAGGVADATTKRAQQRKITSFVVRAGSFDDYRFQFDLNRPITKKLAVRLNTLVWTRKHWRDFEHMDRQSAALAVTWRPFEGTSIRVDSEYGKVDELKAQPWPALDSVGGWLNAGRPISQTLGAVVTGSFRTAVATRTFISNSNEIVSINGTVVTNAPRSGALSGGLTAFQDDSVVPYTRHVMGPGSTTNNDFLNAGVFLEQRITDRLYLEAAANQQHIHRDWVRVMQWNNARIYGDPNAFRPDGTRNPFVGQYFVEMNSQPNIDHRDQIYNDYRLTGTYRFELGRFGAHRVAGLASRRDFFNRGRVRTLVQTNNPAAPAYNNAANNFVRRTYLSMADGGARVPGYDYLLPNYFYDPFESDIAVNGIETGLYTSSLSNTLSRFESRVATMQSRFFRNRLVTTIGVRRDGQTNWGSTLVREPVHQEVIAATRNSDSKQVTGNTATFGAVWHARPWLSFAANTSSNANPQNYIAFGPDATNANIPIGNREGEGMDLGARFELFNRRVHGSVTYFQTDERNAVRAGKGGNAGSGWMFWLNAAASALGLSGDGTGEFGLYGGEDTVDIKAQGWETEWVINVNRSLRLVLNGSRSKNFGSNQWPRITPIAVEMIARARANPNLPVTGVANNTTLAALANTMQNQQNTDHETDGKPIVTSRPYTANLVVNYRFVEGRLKGLAATLGANFRGRRVIGYHTVTHEAVMDGDYNQFNLSVSYDRAIRLGGRKVDWGIAIQGTNILGDRYGLLPTMGDEIGIDRFTFEVTPTVFVTNRFSF